MLVISDNVILILEKAKDCYKLTTWGMINSLENIKRNMEKKEFITLVWSSSLVDPLNFMDEIPEEEIRDENFEEN